MVPNPSRSILASTDDCILSKAGFRALEIRVLSLLLFVLNSVETPELGLFMS